MDDNTTETSSDHAETTAKYKTSLEAVLFDLFIFAVVSLLVSVALFSLGPGARLMPLIIGVPTLLGITSVLLFDLLSAKVRGGKSIMKAPQHKTEQEQAHSSRAPQESGDAILLGGDTAEEAHGERQSAKREGIFALWAIGFFVLTVLFGLLISIPSALFFFLKILNKEGWILSTAITVSTWLFVYVLFGVVLGVQF